MPGRKEGLRAGRQGAKGRWCFQAERQPKLNRTTSPPDPGHDKLAASCLGDSSALQDYLHLQGRGWARKGAIQSAERPQSRGNTNGGSTSAGMASIT